MRRIIFSIFSFLSLGNISIAGDFPSWNGSANSLQTLPVWNGFYTGLNLGGGWTANNGYVYQNVWNLGGVNGGVSNNINSGGIIGGGQFGYNYSLTPLLLIGVEADIQGTGIGSAKNNSNSELYTLAAFTNPTFGLLYPSNAGVSINWYGTVRGRLGWNMMPSLLIYGTGGFLYGSVQNNSGWMGSSNSANQTGWTAGGGAEWMFMPNWSAKAEYLYSSMSGNNYNEEGWNLGVGLNNVNNHTNWNTIRAGVNYHFNFGDVTPVVAKY